MGLLVGLWRWESLRRDGRAGTGARCHFLPDAGARLRVSQCHRARNEVERGRGGGLVRGGWRAPAGQRAGDLSLQTADGDRQSGWGDGLTGLGRDGPKE